MKRQNNKSMNYLDLTIDQLLRLIESQLEIIDVEGWNTDNDYIKVLECDYR